MIRALNELDVDQFIKIRKDSLQLDVMSFGAHPDRRIDRDKTYSDLKKKNEENFILGYFDEEELVGMLGFIRHTNPKTRHKGFIWGVFVYESYRGKGIGKQLTMLCISKASELVGLEKITLGASHISKSALNLYKKMDFVEYGREENAMIWEGRYIDEILFHKYL